MADPEPGKPRMYPLLAVYEAAILVHFTGYGWSLNFARSAICGRLEDAFGLWDDVKVHGHPEFWKSEFVGALEILTEFDETDLDDPSYWSVVVGRGSLGAPEVERVRVVKRDSVLTDMVGRAPVFVVVNITEIIAGVDEVLTERLKARETDAE